MEQLLQKGHIALASDLTGIGEATRTRIDPASALRHE
jgi:hypothetical protein